VVRGLPVLVEDHAGPGAGMVEHFIAGKEPLGVGTAPRLQQRLGAGRQQVGVASGLAKAELCHKGH
jgi:hypothetical protein